MNAPLSGPHSAHQSGIATLATLASIIVPLLYAAAAFGAAIALAHVPLMFVDTYYSDTIGMFVIAIGFAAIGFLGICLLCVPLFAWWVWRAQANLVAAQVSGLRYSPAWATSAFFVPLINFVVPFRAMREIAIRSSGEDEYQMDMDVPIVSAWWSFHLAGLVFMTGATLVFIIQMVPGLYVLMPDLAMLALNVLAYGLLAASAWCAAQILRQVTRNQLAGHHQGHTATFA